MQYRAYGLFGIALVWAGLLILLTRWPRFIHKSISEHAAASKRSYWFFSICQTISGVLTGLFLLKGIVPYYHVGFVYVLSIVITVALQLVSTWVPAIRKGHISKPHAILAYAMAFWMLVLSVLFIFVAGLSNMSRIFAAATSIFMVSTIVAMSFHQVRPKYLYYQVTYIVLFQLLILAAAY